MHRTCVALLLLLGLAAGSDTPPPDQERDDLLRRADASVRAAAERVKDDPDRPIYHVLPPAGWNNDPNGPLFHGGYYHLFYQLNPYGDQWGNMHWGHVRSRDLAHWEHLPIALWPSKGRGEQHVFSGCAAVTKQGRVLLLYTSIGNRLPEQWAAVPEDDQLLRWRKHPANPILTEKLHGDRKVYEWRDPFVFEHGGQTYLVLGGNLNNNQGGQAVVNVYRAESDDLTRWKYLGVLFRHPDAQVKNIECPLFFPLGDKWLLIVSPHGPVGYFIGTLDPATMTFRAEQRGVLDAGNYYAPNCLADPQGRRLLWGWVNGFPAGRGWNGCLTLPRVLTLGPDGTLRQQPAAELQKLRGAGAVEKAMTLTTSQVLASAKGDVLEILAEIDPGDAQEVGLRLRRSEDGRNGVPVTFDGRHLDVAGRKVPFSLPASEKTLRLHAFLDKSALEVYANDRLCVTRVLQAGKDHRGVEVIVRGGTAQLRSLASWPLGSIWTPAAPPPSEAGKR